MQHILRVDIQTIIDVLNEQLMYLHQRNENDLDELRLRLVDPQELATSLIPLERHDPLFDMGGMAPIEIEYLNYLENK